MIFYIATLYLPLFGLLFTPFLKGSLDKVVLLMLVISEAVLLGLKSEGHDYLSYLDYFDQIQRASSLDEVIVLVKDPLLYFIVKVIDVFSTSSEVVFFVVALISLAIVVFSFPPTAKLKSATFCLFILFFGGGMYYEAIRAGLGLSFFYLFIRFRDRRGGFAYSLLPVAAHLSLAIPVVASFGWLNRIIARHPLKFCLSGLMSAKLIPFLLLLNARASWYVNAGQQNPSIIAIVLMLLILCYLWTTKKILPESDARLALTSSALVTVVLSVVFSPYSDTLSSRLHELFGAIMFFLVVRDCAGVKVARITALTRLAFSGMFTTFALIQCYLYYMRFFLEY
jgi:hypothetical protein